MTNARFRYAGALLLRVVLLSCSWFTAAPTPNATAAQSDNSPLAKLAEISVTVHVTPPDDTVSPHLATLLRTPHLLASSIQTKIELEIRRSTKLRIVPNAATTLHAVIGVSDIGEASAGRVVGYYCIVRLFLEEPVRIVRNGVLSVEPSWQSTQSHSWGGDDSVITDLNSKLDIPLNEFLNQYLAANPQ